MNDFAYKKEATLNTVVAILLFLSLLHKLSNYTIRFPLTI